MISQASSNYHFAWHPEIQTRSSLCIRSIAVAMGISALSISIFLACYYPGAAPLGTVVAGTLGAASLFPTLAIALLIKQTKKQAVETLENGPLYPDLNTFNASINTLAFQGGSNKSIGYIGALQALEENAILPRVMRVAGTSAGAAFATLIALSYTSKEAKTALIKLFRNKKLYPTSIFPSDKEKACRFQIMMDWAESIIKSKIGNANVTFGEFRELIGKNRKYKHLHIFAHSIHEERVVDFTTEPPVSVRVRIADALVASMSVPHFCDPVCLIEDKKGDSIVGIPQQRYRRESSCLGMYDDCGIEDTWNLPVHVFNTKRYSQFILKSEENPDVTDENRGLIGFATFNAEPYLVLFNQPHGAGFKMNHPRIVDIDVLGLCAASAPNKQQIEESIASGLSATRTFFSERMTSHSLI